MKKIKFLASLMLMFACVNFSSCSSDSDDNDEPASESLEGTWVCIQSDYIHHSSHDDEISESGIELGDVLICFNSDFTSADKLMSGKKCFWVSEDAYASNPSKYTVNKWNEEIIWYHGDQEFEPLYTLKGNVLTIFDCDMDRFVGNIKINGSEMTYTYRYQVWTYGNEEMDKEFETHVAKFRKK